MFSARMTPFLVSLVLATSFGTRATSQTAPMGSVVLRNDFVPLGRPQMACVYGLSGPLPKHLGRVEVLDATGAVIKAGGLVADGLFNLGVVAIPGSTPGGAGNIVIRAWDTSTGDSFDATALRAQTLVTLTQLGGGDLPPPRLGDVSDFAGLFVLPLTSGPGFVSVEKRGNATIRIQCDGNLGEAFRLWGSNDLLHWREAADLQIAGPSDEVVWRALATWDLDPSSAPHYFRITDYWSLPTDPR
ncbi:MAG: hypothetical protein J0L84_00695 [Verrucomicrobia bacterium]|nr:hypothetical protein [Verrucomicrobiota bacterium]